MSNNVCALSKGAACEAGKLIVQVVGKDHPSTQKLVICDEKNAPLISLTQQDKPEIQASDSFSSVLHVWDWEGQPKRTLCLEIETESGNPIRLPLLDDAKSTPRQEDRQWNQVVPIIPMAPMRGVDNDRDQGVPVLGRPGYLYVFYQGKLWRELEIRQAEDGTTTYHDIDLRAARKQDGFISGSRTARGKGLKEVWLPARWNNRKVDDLQLAYAEVQLPAPRLQRLEQDASLRAQRCQSIDTQISAQEFRRLANGPDNRALARGIIASAILNNPAAAQAAVNAEASRHNLTNRLFPLSLAKPQRPRATPHELQFDRPAEYLHDLSGEYPATCHSRARAFLDLYKTSQTPNPRSAPEMDALNLCMERELLPQRAAAQQKSSSSANAPSPEQQLAEAEKAWQALPASTDMLADARTRQIAAVMVEDDLYRLRQLSGRMDAAQQRVHLAAELATQQPHHASAMLVSNFILPTHIDGQTNPLNRFAENLNSEGRRRVRHDLGAPLKGDIEQYHRKTRECLTTCLKSHQTQQTLGDLFCLEGFDYLGAFALTGQCMTTLAKRFNDPLNFTLRPPATGKAERLLIDLARNKSNPLHAMLWPEVEPQACFAPYVAPTAPEQNLGDGRFRPQALAALERSTLPDLQKLELLEARLLVAGAERGDFKTLLGVEKTVAATMTVLGNFWAVMDDVLGAEANLAQARQNRDQQQVEVDRQNQRTSRIQRHTASRSRLAHLELYIDPSPYSPVMDMIRGSLPETLGDLHFERSGRVNEREYYIFHPDLLGGELTQQQATRMTGSLLDGQGNPIATTNIGTARQAGMALQKLDVYQMVLPKQHATAARMQAVSRRLTEQYRAQLRLVEQQAAYDQAKASPHLNQASEARRGIYRLLSTPVMPALLTMVEMWNVKAEYSSLEVMLRTRDEVRARFGLGSAAVDLVLALEILAERLAHDIRTHHQATFFTHGMDSVAKALDHKLWKIPGSQGRIFATHLTGRVLLNAGTAFLFAALSVSDAMHEFALGDEAGWGYAVMALGGVSIFAATFMAGPAAGAPLLALGPAGWATAIGLALVLAGAALVWWLDDTPLEEWLKLGPYGQADQGLMSRLVGSKRPAHLQDPQEAFYRLVSLLAGIHIRVETNPHHAEALQGHPGSDPEERAWFYSMRRANIRISIESNLPGLVGSLGRSQLRGGTWLRLLRFDTPTAGHPLMAEQSSIEVELPPGQNFNLGGSQSTGAQTPPSFVAQRQVPGGVELYMEQPTVARSAPYRYDWAVRAQLQVDDGQRQWVFPAPLPVDPLRYDSKNHAKPDYRNVGKAFWADEHNNKP
ncbi:hypothetical protein O203_00300 [Ectopseudomonas chengduensis]|nr:toxin VasX [Pseudomonas chengduensis]ERH53950.1 hypothetical protein O203_00300 [Pseudomonas chengduensis]